MRIARFGPLLLVSILLATLLLSGCDNDETGPGAPDPPVAGVSPERLSASLNALAFLDHDLVFHLSTLIRAQDLVSAGWNFTAVDTLWKRIGVSYSDVHVGDGQDSYTVRTERRTSALIRLLQGDVPTENWAEADSLVLQESVRRNRFIVQDGFDLDDPYDLSLTYLVGAPLDRGSISTATGRAELTGFEVTPGGAPESLHVFGTVDVALTVVDDDWLCLGYDLAVDLSVMDDTLTEIDQYTGQIGTEVGHDAYGGTLSSREGDGAYTLNGHRSCSE